MPIIKHIDDTHASAPGACDNSSIYKHTYELTVKYVKGNPKRMSDSLLMAKYALYIDMLSKDGIKVVDIHYENEGYLHLHAIIEAPTRIYPYPRMYGYSTQFSQQWKTKGLSGWIGYITKELDPQYMGRKAQWRTEQYFKENCGFSD